MIFLDELFTHKCFWKVAGTSLKRGMNFNGRSQSKTLMDHVSESNQQLETTAVLHDTNIVPNNEPQRS